MKDLAHLNKYLLKYKYHLIFGTVFIIISNLFGVIPAVVVRHSFDLIQGSFQVYNGFEGFGLQKETYDLFASSILIFGVVILVSAMLKGIFMFFMRQTIIVMSRLIEYDLKNEIYEHYQTLSLSFYRKNNTGDLMNRISEDVSRVRMYVGPAIMYGINLFTMFLIVIPFMLSINVELTLYSLLPLPFLSFSIYYVNNIINKRSEEIQESLSGLSTFVQEAFSGIRVIKAFVREEDYNQKFSAASDDYKDKSLRLAFVQALFFPLIMSLIGMSVILTVYVGSIGILQGELSTGNIAEFIIYVNMLTWPVTALGWITSIIQRAAASQKRINEFLHTENDIISEKNIEKDISGDVVFENVTFTYPDSGIQALKEVSFDVKAGESIAIIGTTGSGKSTIANLLCRMYDATGGAVKIDDISIKDYALSSVRGNIGYVPQDVFLFSESIADNIAFGNQTLTEAQIRTAADHADLTENIDRFPKGFQTMLGERGITLSGGQKQRVSIARAIAREPKILIMDDCLSAVDTKTENSILNSMKKIMVGRTTVIISHRVSSAQLADKIIVLDSGQIVEQGSHKELIGKDGTYKSLYDKQIHGEELSATTE
ncbi:ABC transporter ATP-binding protein/permease [Reichenbachiella carrageenanivorans]|uniref:ABC transporter ATP-binding protein/permease n=1 Tax=Reichenbachiella carrageenanivorans TaxID=2979869 RepID=A0ABY6D884_9BACT|nr:ABC transporter ATP-binding protein [Reichenbachiella carrageenanivorans]UXX80075.1 ABC transporter ATP-binding protein/permease [Reichenbachiella carrageenanivorans]